MPVFAYRCPDCRAPLQQQGDTLSCAAGHRFTRKQGIWPLLTAEARQRLAPFLRGYGKVREAEGWARPDPDSDIGPNAAYYLALPDYDLSGLYNATWKLRGRNFRDMYSNLKRLDPVTGLNILDLGAGNCWLSRHLAAAGHNLCAVDVNMHPADGLPVARVYFDRLPVRFARAEGEMDNIPLQDTQFDVVIANAALHYAPHLDAAMREIARVLKPGGVLVVLDSPFYTDPAAGEEMVADLRAAYARYRLPSDTGPGYFTDAGFSELAAQHRLGRIEWRGRWRRGAVNLSALKGWLTGLFRRDRREQATLPIVFAFKQAGAAE